VGRVDHEKPRAGHAMALAGGGFVTSSTRPVMRALIQVTGVDDPHGARLSILARSEEIAAKANEKDPMLVRYGGGVVGLEANVVSTRKGPMVVVHLLVDCRDAMGANAVNTMAEEVAPFIEEITGEIYDETDEDEELDIEDGDDGTVRIRASVHLEEVADHFKVLFGDEGEYDTLAGFLISELGRIPQTGESLDHEGVRFTVEEADERRVSWVRAERIDLLPLEGELVEPRPADG
ncbi:MAG: transporter associated domain-containing protein, partial [Trueperaceae bacterium]|nr:transporter associated domain-containing protein [Trueperaceae bacterium]